MTNGKEISDIEYLQFVITHDAIRKLIDDCRTYAEASHFDETIDVAYFSVENIATITLSEIEIPVSSVNAAIHTSHLTLQKEIQWSGWYGN